MRSAVLGFEFCKNDFGALDHGIRQTGEFRDLNAVAAVGRAGHDFMKEDHVSVPFLYAHRNIHQPRQPRCECCELMKMRCEQRAAAVGFMKMLYGSPCNG